MDGQASTVVEAAVTECEGTGGEEESEKSKWSDKGLGGVAKKCIRQKQDDGQKRSLKQTGFVGQKQMKKNHI